MKPIGLSILIAIGFLGAPFSAIGDMLDVNTVRLNEGCTVEQYAAIADDFNAYYKDKGYQTEIVVPFYSDQGAGTAVWVGRSASYEAFGKAYDHWRAEVQKPGSTVSKLSARLTECATSESRSSYTTAR
jgi:hypothetical protein